MKSVGAAKNPDFISFFFSLPYAHLSPLTPDNITPTSVATIAHDISVATPPNRYLSIPWSPLVVGGSI